KCAPIQHAGPNHDEMSIPCSAFSFLLNPPARWNEILKKKHEFLNGFGSKIFFQGLT
ncbi:MAG: hypothetical protein ACJA0W_003016, partial [Candidatus Azotimanducaceae bacterium]